MRSHKMFFLLENMRSDYVDYFVVGLGFIEFTDGEITLPRMEECVRRSGRYQLQDALFLVIPNALMGYRAGIDEV